MTLNDQDLLMSAKPTAAISSGDEWVPNYLQQPLESIVQSMSSSSSVLQSRLSGDWMKSKSCLNSDDWTNGDPKDISISFRDMMSCSKSHFKATKCRITSNDWMLSSKINSEHLQQSIPTDYIFNDECTVDDDWETSPLNSFLSCSIDSHLSRFCDINNDVGNLSLEANMSGASTLELALPRDNTRSLRPQVSLCCEKSSEDEFDLSDNEHSLSADVVVSAHTEAEGYCVPTESDVLLGRGGLTNHHPGNKRYREEVERLKPWYESCRTKPEKKDVSQLLVEYIRSYGGRFLEKDKIGGRWVKVEFNLARKKASQALREGNKKRQKRNGSEDVLKI